MPDKALQQRAAKIIQRLRKARPGAKIELEFSNPLELLVATILSAQCTDQRVNLVTRSLFPRYRSAADYAEARPAKFEQEIRSTGFFRQKTKSIVAAARELVARYGGEVPGSLEELTTLPGVARKTANVVLSAAFGKAEGIVVDTHVQRVAYRLGLTTQKNPEKIERDLMDLLPPKYWNDASTQLVLHGRYICIARRPKCSVCPLRPRCDRVGVTESA
jgi:endonuclease-3